MWVQTLVLLDNRTSLYCDDHSVVRCQILNSHAVKAHGAHPANTLLCGEVEARFRHDQHVQARQHTSSIDPARVIDQPLIHDNRATGWDRRVSFSQ